MKKSSLTAAGKAKPRGSLKGQRSASVESDSAAEMQLEDIRELLWCALPAVQPHVQQYKERAASNADSTGDANEPAPHGTFDHVEVPWSDMQTLVTSLFLATHTNAIPEDVDCAVAGIVGTAAEPVQTWYSKHDVNAFLDSVPCLWMTLQDNESVSDRQFRQFSEELVKAVTDDEPPFALVERKRILTVVRATTLFTPLDHFVTLPPVSPCAPVFSVLWSNMVDGRASTTISLSQFRVFFVWFYALHFDGTTSTRSEAVAEYVYRRFRGGDASGMPLVHFEAACRYLTRAYAQRRDTEYYLEELVLATHEALRAHNKDTTGSVFFSIGESVVGGIAPRKALLNPQANFMADELCPWHHDAELYQTPLSENRICLYGKRCTGKTTAGKALAARLHCAHLDVVDIAERLLASNDTEDALTQQLQDALRDEQPISLALQAALLRRELELKGLYHGYVWSDTFPVTPQTVDTVSELLQEAGIASRVQPNILVHLTCGDEEVYRARLSTTQAQRAADLEAVLNDPVAIREKQTKARAAKRAECEAALTHLVTLEGAEQDGMAENGEGISAELETARAKAAEAQEQLEQLEKEEQQAQDEQSAEEERVEDEAPLDEEERARRTAQQSATLALLVDAGRQVLLEPFETDPQVDEQELTAIPCMKKVAEGANALSQHLIVDGLSETADLVQYVVEALQLRACVTATIPPLDDDTDPASFPPTVAGDEQLGKALEDAATTAGYTTSAVWKHNCPVTFKEDEVLLEGASCYLCVYRGEIFYCASALKRERFMGNPFYYLKETPATRQRTLVVATDRLLASLAETNLDLDVMADQLSSTLHLTRIDLAAYAEAVRERRDLKQARKEVLMGRRQEFAEERQARDERMEKRMKLEAKKKKKDKRKSDGRHATVRFANDVPAGNAGGVPRRKVLIQDAVRERIQDVLAKTIAEEKEKRHESVPVLLAMLDANGVDKSAFDLLYAERMVPERVLVLDHSRKAVRSDDDEEGENEGDNEDANDISADADAIEGDGGADSTVPSVMDALLHQLEHGAPTGWKKDDSGLPPQSFTLERVNVAGKSELELLLEIGQLMCPGAVPCKEGYVNAELGNEEDREEDPDIEEEAAQAEEEDENFPPLPPAPSQHALALPGPRFLNQFGNRLDYCPVTLHEKRLVVHGKHDYCCEFRNQLYVFASESCRQRFQVNPLKYVNAAPPRDVPPRIWIVGTTNSGRHTLARDLQASFQIPFFSYDRKFFEACIEATMQPGGAEVGGIRIPGNASSNPYVVRAQKLLKQIRDAAEAEEKGLKLRAEAEQKLEEQERRAELAAESSDPDEEFVELDEEEEEKLRMQAEFEPEDEDEKQTRMTESYLRIASCVTRFEPFESKGYIMVCPPFSELDQDVLFAAGGIPEVVIYMRQSAETFRQRAEISNAAIRAARDAFEATKQSDPTRQAKALAREQRRRERLLSKWRRRHIGADDPSSEPEKEDNDGELVEGARGETEVTNDAFDEMDVDGTLSLETDAIEEFITAVKERQVDVVTIDADRPFETVRRLALDKLHGRLEDRLSFFCACEVVAYDVAMKRVAEGRTNLSCFGLHDPVRLYERRLGKRRACTRKPDGVSLIPEGVPLGDEGSSRLGSANGGILGGHSLTTYQSDGADTLRADDSLVDGDREAPAEEPEHEGEEEELDELSEYGSEDLGEMLERHKRRERILAKRAAPRACQLGCRTFFFDTENSLLDFMRNPLFFIEQPPLLPGLRQKPVLTVFEDDPQAAQARFAPSDVPAEGHKRRSTAEHTAYNLKYEFVSVPKLLSWAALHPRLGSLRTRALKAAMQCCVDDALIASLLALKLADARVKRCGAVLLNLPRTKAQYEATQRNLAAAASPIVKVASLTVGNSSSSSGTASPMHGGQTSGERGGAADMTCEMLPVLQSSCASSLALAVPFPSNPSDVTNVVEMVHCLDDLERTSRDLLLRAQNGFPANLENTYYTQAALDRSISEYRTYCPYCWADEGDLVEAGNSPFRVTYLGRIYFFHSALHMLTFLSHPTTVADPTTLHPLPPHLPERLSAEACAGVNMDVDVAYQGCCPVVLHDTREKRGLCGVVEPVAEQGSRDCIVRYDGKLFAMRDESNLERFVRRPWQYVEGAAMPPSRKCPLTPRRRADGVEDEEFVRRQLYDSIAHALVAVATERPSYPGLSAEESALKYIALHLKAHNVVENNSIQDEQYKNQLEVFRKRATLYTTADTEDQLPEEACAEYERMRCGFQKVGDFAKLKKVA